MNTKQLPLKKMKNDFSEGVSMKKTQSRFIAFAKKTFYDDSGKKKTGSHLELFFQDRGDPIDCIVTYKNGLIDGEQAIDCNGYYETWCNGIFIEAVDLKI